jgi:hypothetical protein
MKLEVFKKMIKDSVKEAIQEELKDILLEAVRSPKTVLTETYAQPHLENPKKLSPEERRNIFSGMLGEMQTGGIATSQYAGNMQVNGAVDVINGALPEGSVGLDQIMALMGK